MPSKLPPGILSMNPEHDAKFCARADEGATWVQIARESSAPISAERIRQIVERARRRAKMKARGWLTIREEIASRNAEKEKAKSE